MGKVQSETPRAKPSQNEGLFAGACFGIGGFHLLLFLISCFLLATQASAVDSQFAQQAFRDHGLYIVLSSLGLLRGYALVAFAYVMVLYPLLLLWASRRPFGKRGCIWRAALLSALCLGLLFLRMMALRPYFVTQWLPEWDFQLVPGGPSLIKDIFLLGLLNGLPIVAILAVGLFWLRRLRAFVQAVQLPRLRPVTAVAVAVAAVGLWVTPKAIRAHLAEPPGRPNIIIIASDSLRPDHLSCNGYHRETSPHVDALASRSVNFTRCFTPIGSTLESMVSMLSSQYPHTHGIRQMFPNRETIERVNRETPKLPEILARAGYETAVVGDWCGAIFNEVPMGFESVQVSQFDSFRIWLSQAVYLSHPVIPLYFDNEFGYWLFPKLQSFAHYLRPEVITQRTIEKIDERKNPDQPFFYTVFTGCNHFAYHAPYPYYQQWTDPEYRGPNKYQVHFDPGAFMSDPDWDQAYASLSSAEKRHIVDLYDGCVSRFDDCVGRIVAALERRDLLENTIILITSDHGEDLFEPGTTLTHGTSFNGGDQGNLIPCILHVPWSTPKEIDAIVRNLDLAPTLLELVGLPPDDRFEGVSLRPLLEGDSDGDLDLAFYGETGYPFVRSRIPGEETLAVPPLESVTYIDQTFDYHIVLRPDAEEAMIRAKQRCLRLEEWKLVYTPGANGPIHRLFHTPSDPYCQVDVGAQYPDVLRRLRSALWRWIITGEELRGAEILKGPVGAEPSIPPSHEPGAWRAAADA